MVSSNSTASSLGALAAAASYPPDSDADLLARLGSPVNHGEVPVSNSSLRSLLIDPSLQHYHADAAKPRAPYRASDFVLWGKPDTPGWQQ